MHWLLRTFPGVVRFSNSYTTALIGAVITLLIREYGGSQFGTPYYSKLLASMAPAGTVFYLLICGWWSDNVYLAAVCYFMCLHFCASVILHASYCSLFVLAN
ncbi:hypothetical protein EDC04DRAFT_2821773 [Pisolithus marmoratus]|nr:hypothetical protein EDC04DRAFT_2821773 [Pisolithus marmoratus]